MLRFHLSSAVALMAGMTSLAIAQPDNGWTHIGTDLEFLQRPITSRTLFNPTVTAIRTTLTSYQLQVVRATEIGQRRTTAKRLCRYIGGAACLNANFFDEQGRPLGVVMSRGVIFQNLHRGGDTLTAVLTVSPDGPRIFHRSNFSPREVTEAVQAGPRLVASGSKVPGLRKSLFGTNLSAACVDREKRFLIIRITSGLIGASLDAIQELLIQPPFSCYDAINFDGGGSSQLYIGSDLPGGFEAQQEMSLPADDDVPVVLALVLRTEAERTASNH
jgi:Phosphodiester glycosidase